jgi:hypothetical protein
MDSGRGNECGETQQPSRADRASLPRRANAPLRAHVARNGVKKNPRLRRRGVAGRLAAWPVARASRRRRRAVRHGRHGARTRSGVAAGRRHRGRTIRRRAHRRQGAPAGRPPAGGASAWARDRAHALARVRLPLAGSTPDLRPTDPQPGIHSRSRGLRHRQPPCRWRHSMTVGRRQRGLRDLRAQPARPCGPAPRRAARPACGSSSWRSTVRLSRSRRLCPCRERAGSDPWRPAARRRHDHHRETRQAAAFRTAAAAPRRRGRRGPEAAT